MGRFRNRADARHFAYSLYFSAGALAREVEKLATACWKPVGLSPSQGQIIIFLLDVSMTGPAIIARTLLLSRSTVTRLLDGLERKELILRFAYDGVTTVTLSQKAMALEEEFLKCDREMSRRWTGLLGDDHATGLMKQMNKATDKLRGVDEDEGPECDTESDRDYRHLLP